MGVGIGEKSVHLNSSNKEDLRVACTAAALPASPNRRKDSYSIVTAEPECELFCNSVSPHISNVRSHGATKD